MAFTQVFISHSSHDAIYANALVKLLRESIKLKKYEITCTSHPDHGVPVGKRVSSKLLKQIDDCGILVALMSKQSLSSFYCTIEIGAAMAFKRPIAIVLCPGTKASDVPPIISERHLLQWRKVEGLDQLLTLVRDETGSDMRCKPAVVAKLVSEAARCGLTPRST